MFLSQFALNLKYYLIDKKKWRIAEGIFTDLLYRTYDFQNFESRTLSYGISLRWIMENELVLKNNLKEARAKKQISQRELAEMGRSIPQYDQLD